MQSDGFEEALWARVDDMLNACTRCGACFAACPITEPAGLAAADPSATVAGALDILRLGEGTAEAARWATACTLSGECIKACNYGVNPRFLLVMARLALARKANEPAVRRKRGVEAFRKLSQEVSVLPQLQLSEEALIRLGQRPAKEPPRTALPDVVFYTGCNVLRTPHLALLCLDIMDVLGIDYQVMGGPTHCCGIHQLRAGDVDALSRFAGNTINKLAQSKTGQVLAWCPSCFVQLTENTLPTFERATGERPIDLTPFVRFLSGRIDTLRPLLKGRAEMKVALHRHPGMAGVAAAAEELLRAVPGVTVIRLDIPAVGLQSNSLAVLPAYQKELQLKELELAGQAGVDALVSVYHTDHRELCAHERDWPFQILNVLDIVGASMGLHQDDHYKAMKIKQDVDAIISDASDLIKQHGISLDTARTVIVNGMLSDQPLPLQGPRQRA
jgi:Fe-S oxidoreductase